MCKEYINLQTKEVLDLKKVSTLPDNALLKIRPELWCEWDFDKNNELGLDIWKMTKALKLDSHWIDSKGHRWKTKIGNRGKGSNCIYCDNKEIWIGYNDINTTRPDVASLMLNKEDRYRYTQKSDKRVDFKCPDCDSIMKDIQIKNVSRHGLKCVICSDGYSYPEKIMYNILTNLNIDFNFDRRLKWSGKRRYDFYIPSKSLIIEMHGYQHYGKGFVLLSDRNDELIDKEKRNLAMVNGIINYIEVDARISDFEFIKNNIIKNLSHILALNNVDWDYVINNSMKSMIIKTLDLWNSGVTNPKEISKELNIHEGTVYGYLRKLSKLGKCNADEILIGNKRRIVQLSLNGEYLRTFDSTYDASDFLGDGSHHQNIINTCKNKRNQCKGFNWMYEEDHISLRNKNLEVPISKKKQEVPVVQLTISGEYIATFISRAEAQRATGANVNSIRNCCEGSQKSAGGYRWLTKEKYNELKDNNLKVSPYKKNTGNPKSIVQLSKDGKFIAEYNSAQEANRVNKKFNSSSILGCCKGRLKSVAGYIWMYKNDYEVVSKDDSTNLKYTTNNKVAVMQLSMNNELLNMFDSLTKASKVTGVHYLGIRKACKGVFSQSGGYKWMYKEEYEKLNNKTS